MRPDKQETPPNATKQRKDKFRKPKQFAVTFSESSVEKVRINNEDYIWHNVTITVVPKGFDFDLL